MDGVLARVAATQRSRLFPAADGMPSHGHSQQQPATSSSPNSGLTFIPAPHFTGTKPGYAFSKGSQGLGYYSETSQLQAMQSPPANGTAGEQNHLDGNGVTGHAKGSKHKRRGLANGAQRHEEGLPSAVDEGESSGEEDGGLMGAMAPMKGAEMTQRELVAQAFAGDDVEADFQQVRLSAMLCETSNRYHSAANVCARASESEVACVPTAFPECRITMASCAPLNCDIGAGAR